MWFPSQGLATPLGGLGTPGPHPGREREMRRISKVDPEVPFSRLKAENGLFSSPTCAWELWTTNGLLTVTPRPSHPRAVLPHTKSHTRTGTRAATLTHLHSHMPLRLSPSEMSPAPSPRAQRGILRQVPPAPPTPAWPDGGGCQAPGELSITANPPADSWAQRPGSARVGAGGK